MSFKDLKSKLGMPEPSLRRLPWYLSHVKLLYADGLTQVSSTAIARGVGLDPALVAKDLSYVSLRGRTRVGYQIQEVIEVLEQVLGFTSSHKAFLLGVGSLGSSLLADKGLKHFGLDIVAGFDVDPDIVGRNIGEVPVFHVDDIAYRMQQDNVSIAILAVPIKQAQQMSTMLSNIGVRAIWNFTPVRIQVPEDIVVQNTSMYAHLALMFSRLQLTQSSED